MQIDTTYRLGTLIIDGSRRGVKRSPEKYGIGEWEICKHMLSPLIQLIATIWSASHHSGRELIAVNLLSCIRGATSETIVMITIVHLFLFISMLDSMGSFCCHRAYEHSEAP
jgi:hypothetical protein